MENSFRFLVVLTLVISYGFFMKKHWQILKPDIISVENIVGALKCNPIIASILVNRHIVSAEDVTSFLKPSLKNLRGPFSIKDMDIAVSRIFSAIASNEKILIFGDYDVDGITAITILFEFFRWVGADVSYYIPHRIKEGYGLQVQHISDYALPNSIKLIITADCGSSSHHAVKAARDNGIDVIITDHHNISERPQQAVAVINPKQHDCNSGFDNLAGVGVAFYLLISLRKHLRDMHFWKNRPEPNLKNLCDLVALGTVADMVPLLNENRIFTWTGLNLINSGNRCGINALIEACGIKTHSTDTQDIAFKLAPRLNAAGRIDHAKSAVKLLATTEQETAKYIAGSLNSMNVKRQEIEKKILDEILLNLRKNPSLLSKKSLVLSHPDWHEGVLGIVASRIVKIYFRPVVLIAVKEDVGKGSSRSIPGFDLYKGLQACSSDLESFGGHSMAGGLKIKAEKIDLFQRNFENAVAKMTEPDDFVRTISIDYGLDFDDISDGLIDELESLKPFGAGNPEPLFMTRNVKVLSSQIVGENHRRMILGQSSGKKNRTFKAIQFNINTGIPLNESFDKIAFRLCWNRWNNKKTAQIVVEEI